MGYSCCSLIFVPHAHYYSERTQTMKRSAVFFALTPAVLGALGAALHTVEINTVLDPVSGLAEPFAPISICLGIISLLSAVIFFALASLAKGKSIEAVRSRAFASKTPVPAVISVLLMALMVYAAYLCRKSGVGPRSSDMFSLVLAIFAALAGLSAALLFITAYLKKGGAETILASLVLVLFSCLWLVITYKESSADPTLINYAYDFLALCASAVAVYYLAGYSFGRSRPRAALFTSMVGVYFCLTAMPKASSPVFRCFYIFMAVYLLMSEALLARNLFAAEEKAARDGSSGADV